MKIYSCATFALHKAENGIMSQIIHGIFNEGEGEKVAEKFINFATKQMPVEDGWIYPEKPSIILLEKGSLGL